jgi:hypothetical protein
VLTADTISCFATHLQLNYGVIKQMTKKERMTFKETMALKIIKERLPISTDEFLKVTYTLLRRELKQRGIIKPRGSSGDKK